jgi:hypothetical protein
LEDVQRDRKISEGLVRAFQQAKVVARWNQWGPTVSCARQLLSIVAPLLSSRAVQSLFGATDYEVKAREREREPAPGKTRNQRSIQPCPLEVYNEKYTSIQRKYTTYTTSGEWFVFTLSGVGAGRAASATTDQGSDLLASLCCVLPAFLHTR